MTWQDLPSAQWVETDPIPVLTPGSLIAFLYSNNFCLFCLVAKSYLLPVYPPPGPWRSSGSIWGCATLSGEFDWMVERSRCGLCVSLSCLSMFLFCSSGWWQLPFPRWAVRVGGTWSLTELHNGDGFFNLLSIQTAGSCVNLNPARSLHELKVFGSHRVLRTCRAFCAVLCSVTTITLALCCSWFFP